MGVGVDLVFKPTCSKANRDVEGGVRGHNMAQRAHRAARALNVGAGIGARLTRAVVARHDRQAVHRQLRSSGWWPHRRAPQPAGEPGGSLAVCNTLAWGERVGWR
jgi:hypothetical protein